MRHIVGGYVIDDDPARIDAGAAVAFLTTQAYWGRWRGEADIRRQISEAWRVVGAYDQAGAMVGFARAFGDGGSAYLSDVYVLPGQRGAGLGQAIVRGAQRPGGGLRAPARRRPCGGGGGPGGGGGAGPGRPPPPPPPPEANRQH